MDDVRVGLVFRAVRRRRGWRQRDVSERARVDQKVISMIERGQIERVTLRTMRRVAAVLEMSVPLEPRWRGANLHQLLDEEHARLVEHVVAALGRLGWQVVAEYTFNVWGERGSVDVVGWHAVHRALLLIEVKSRLVDVQALLAGHDRKRRVVPAQLRRQYGWRPAAVGSVVVVPGTTACRSAVARHAVTFASVLPARSPQVRRWLREPRGDLAGIWFLSDRTHHPRTRAARGPERVRRPGAAAGERGTGRRGGRGHGPQPARRHTRT